MEAVNDFIQWVSLGLYVLLAGVALRLWRRRPASVTAWLATTFSTLAAFVVLGRVFSWIWGEGEQPEVATRLLILGLAAFPYFLYRFGMAFEGPPRVQRRLADATLAIVVLSTLALPSFPEAGEEASTVFNLYLVLFLVAWSWLSGAVAVRLWRAGNGRPTVVRNRVRLLAVAALLLSAALILTGTAGSGADSPPGVIDIVVQVMAMGSSLSFLVAFVPPRLFRAAWRSVEEAELHRASMKLMAARRPEQVTAILLPHVARVTGATAAAVVESGGRVLGSTGEVPDDLTPLLEGESHGVLRHDLSFGVMLLWVGPYTPFFGQEEEQLVRRLGLLADLALDRTALLVRERSARQSLQDANEALEAANDELEAFVYSASHDLKNPLIALLGYLDMLRTDYADRLDDDGRLYLERMTVNGNYMEELIQDLLELSRVGRIDIDESWIDVEDMAADLAHEVEGRAPEVTVRVGELPRVLANPTRTRQLLSNLMDNAVKYGDREDLTITVAAHPGQDGEVVLQVADDGRGIPEEYREKVFGVFERLEVDDTRKSGTGIGLAICRKIAEQMGGRIWVEPSDAGADFRILVPADRVQEASDQPTQDDPVRATL